MVAAHARLSWEAAAFGVHTVWWMACCANPPAVEAHLCMTQGILSGRKWALEHQEMRFVPVLWLFPPRAGCPHTLSSHEVAQSQVSGSEASVLPGTLIRGQILS